MISISINMRTVPDKIKPGSLSLSYFLIQEDNCIIESRHFINKLFVRRIIARLDVRTMTSLLETGLSNF